MIMRTIAYSQLPDLDFPTFGNGVHLVVLEGASARRPRMFTESLDKAAIDIPDLDNPRATVTGVKLAIMDI